MAAELRYRCDVCGVQKGAANHWYTLQLGVDLMQIRTWRTGHVEPAALHICGERCLLTKISERLGRESFAADAQPQVHRTARIEPLEDEPVVVTLRERLDELDSQDVDREVGAR